MTSSLRDMDKLTPEQRRRCMQAIKGRDTLPEIVVRKWLHAHGFRFRVCDKRIVGYPDVVLPKLKTLIETAPSQSSRSGWLGSEICLRVPGMPRQSWQIVSDTVCQFCRGWVVV